MKKLKIQLSLVTSCFLLFTLILPEHIPFASAQTRHAQSGEVSFEVDSKKTQFNLSKESAISYASKLTQLLASKSTIPSPATNDFPYFNAVYLYCSTSNGTCIIPLEGLYEIDLYNSIRQNSPSCPITKQFWKSWLTNGFEERQKYSIKTAFLSATSTFNSQVRPKFIKCEETIKKDFELLKQTQDSSDKRFQEDGTGKEAILKFSNLISTIEEKGIDVFSATGLRNSSEVGQANAETKETKK